MKKSKKSKSFPDLTGDGKVTQADILKGRGVKGMKGGGMMSKKGYAKGGAVMKKKGYAKGGAVMKKKGYAKGGAVTKKNAKGGAVAGAISSTGRAMAGAVMGAMAVKAIKNSNSGLFGRVKNRTNMGRRASDKK